MPQRAAVTPASGGQNSQTKCWNLIAHWEKLSCSVFELGDASILHRSEPGWFILLWAWDTFSCPFEMAWMGPSENDSRKYQCWLQKLYQSQTIRGSYTHRQGKQETGRVTDKCQCLLITLNNQRICNEQAPGPCGHPRQPHQAHLGQGTQWNKSGGHFLLLSK